MEAPQSNKACVICGSEAAKKRFVVTERQLGLGEKFTYLQCSKCGCLQIESIPKDMEKYYQGDSYYSMSLSSRGNLVRLLNALRYSHRIRSLTGWSWNPYYMLGAMVESVLPLDKALFLKFGLIHKGDRILDVGSGVGELLYYMKSQGFPDVQGVDLYVPDDIEYPNGLRITKGEVSDLPPESQFDVIMFNHSLEHVADPRKALISAGRLLADDGKVIVRLPTAYYAWKTYRENWFQIDAPRHYWIPTVDSMRILAHNAGFELVESIFDSSYAQFIVSQQYENGVSMADGRSFSRNVIKSLADLPRILHYQRLAKQLNAEGRGDQCIFVLQRSITSTLPSASGMNYS